MRETQSQSRQRDQRQKRRGVVLVLAALTMIVVMGFAAFAIDVGFMVLTRDEMQNAADAAALAGAMQMNNGASAVRAAAIDIASHNFTGKNNVSMTNADVELGQYDMVSKTFTVNETAPNSVRTTARTSNRKLFFAPVFGNKVYSTSAQSIAMINPRDICFVVDLSGSMNDDTEPAWAPETINIEYASAGYGSIGTTIVNNLYSDLHFGTYPGTIENVGKPLGVANNTNCYYNLQVYPGPLSATSISTTYRILSGDSITTRKTKAYKWIIDNQLARLMPNAQPLPNSSNATSLAYWNVYLDYVIASVTVSSTAYPPNPGENRISSCNNPNLDTHPTTSSNLPDKYYNQVGYQTYVQFLGDMGRDRTPTVANATNSSLALVKTEISKYNTSMMHTVVESTPAGNFTFPPREQPVHACRRSIIAALKVLEDQNASIQDPWEDHVSIVTFDAIDAYHTPKLELALTASYRTAMQTCTQFQAVGDMVSSTATENGIIMARNHLKTVANGGAGRVFTNKVCVLLTDGVPNLYQSSSSTVSTYISAHPSTNFFSSSTANLPYNSVIMQAGLMDTDNVQIFPVGTGLGADYDFMDRVARLNGTAKNGQAPRGTGNPASNEATLTSIFTSIIQGGRVRLVH
jgi:Flp pilus assembly protein TadG